jgi:hypothetical protein
MRHNGRCQRSVDVWLSDLRRIWASYPDYTLTSMAASSASVKNTSSTCSVNRILDNPEDSSLTGGQF